MSSTAQKSASKSSAKKLGRHTTTTTAVNIAQVEKGWINQTKPDTHNYFLKHMLNASDSALKVGSTMYNSSVLYYVDINHISVIDGLLSLC